MRTGRILSLWVAGTCAAGAQPFTFGVNYEGTANLVDVAASSRTTGNSWEFPLLVKYRFPSRIIRPYVAAGPAWDTLTGLEQAVTRTVFPSLRTTTTTGQPAELKNNTVTGFVIAGGVDIHALLLHLSPEIRYTRWASPHFADPNGLLQSNQNQAGFLLGITF